MEYEQRIELQKKFGSIHRIMVLLAIIIMLGEGATNVNGFHLTSLFFTLSFAMIDRMLVKYVSQSKKKNDRILVLFRYFQIIVAIGMISCCRVQIFPYFPYCYLFFLLSIVEYFFLLDILDGYYRILWFLTLCIAVSIVPLVMEFIGKYQDGNFLRIYMMLLITIFVFLILAKIVLTIFERIEARMVAIASDVEKEKDRNQYLEANQEKLKKANDMLEIQKIKLEVAYNKINNVNTEMTIQNEIMQYISSSLEIGKLMDLITDSIVKEIGVDICGIVLYPQAANNKEIQYRIKTNLPGSYVKVLGEYIQNHCFDEYLDKKECYVDNHVKISKYPFLSGNFIGSILMVPLFKEEKGIGVLYVGNSTYNYFTENMAFFEGIVAQFLIALENANLYNRMREMAIRDGLTGIFNRRYLNKLFEYEVKDAIAKNTNIAVALFDIDYFKKINDTYGHIFGDEVIKQLAKRASIIAQLYNSIVARYGGEEFVLLIPGKSLSQAVQIAELLFEEVKKMEFRFEEEKIHINISMGITSFPEVCSTPKDLLSHADWAMYYSKQRGRNCITIDGPEIQNRTHKK